MTGAPRFLTLAEALLIHQDQIRRYGGKYGLLDLGLLGSALAQPEAGYSGRYLHRDLFAMATAYAYHICQNHPFADGNKRAALASALVFLDLNGITLRGGEEELFQMMMSVADGKKSKDEIAEVIRGLAGT